MTLTFPELIILLLPGFFALWVYQGFSYEEINKRGDAHTVSLGLMFGMVSLGAFALLDLALPCDLAIRLNGDPATLMSWRFAWRYAVLSATALLVGVVSGALCRSKAGTPVWRLRRAGAKLLKINPTTAVESALNYALQEMSKNDTPLLIGVSDYEGGPFKVLGFYYSNSFAPQELVLTHTNLFRGLAGIELQFVRSRRANTVVLQNGLIVTLMQLSPKQREDLIDSLEQRRTMISERLGFYRS